MLTSFSVQFWSSSTADCLHCLRVYGWRCCFVRSAYYQQLVPGNLLAICTVHLQPIWIRMAKVSEVPIVWSSFHFVFTWLPVVRAILNCVQYWHLFSLAWFRTVEDFDNWVSWLMYKGGVGVKGELSWESWWEEEQVCPIFSLCCNVFVIVLHISCSVRK